MLRFSFGNSSDYERIFCGFLSQISTLFEVTMSGDAIFPSSQRDCALRQRYFSAPRATVTTAGAAFANRLVWDSVDAGLS